MPTTEGRLMPSISDDSRYPYTYACDFVREHVMDFNEAIGCSVPTLSRSEASQCMAAFEKVFGLSHEDMAKKLADYAIAQKVG